MNIRRLQPGDAADIVDCFRRVYGDSYANELFYDRARLAECMAEQRLGCVGAVNEAGVLVGHMAMTVHAGARSVELGNTVVDPAARGQGIAWQIGAALKAWCVELGYGGYLHYPTTAHHVMQRQSVINGFETGLMLGYIPAETDGRVGDRPAVGRQAATIVYEPLDALRPAREAVYLPDYGAEVVRDFSRATGLERTWLVPDAPADVRSEVRPAYFDKRGLARLSIERVGQDLAGHLRELERSSQPCRQIDFSMADPGIQSGVERAQAFGYWFCGWLPGHGRTDVFRLQNVDRSRTDLSPNLVNPAARHLLRMIPPDGPPRG